MHYNADNSYLFANRKEIFRFKASNKNSNFPSQIYLGSISNKFDNVDLKEASFKENVYDSSFNYDTIDKSSSLNIHKYLMNKNNK